MPKLMTVGDGRSHLGIGSPIDILRRDVLDALFASGGGHYGGSLSVLDVLWTLYTRVLRTSANHATHPTRDRLILSKGHAAPALYAVLRRLGYFDENLASYARAGSPLQGHPDMTALKGIDFSTGSLGHGVSVGLGMALALRGSGARVWIVVGDGECQEGQIWEAAMLAARLRLDHLHVVVDHNRFQEWGWKAGGDKTLPLENAAAKWLAFGWRVREVDGHDQDALAKGCSDLMLSGGCPSVMIAHTVKGKGFAAIEADPIRFHCATIDESEHLALRGDEAAGW